MAMPTILFVGDSITVGAVGSPDKTGFRGPFSLKMPGVAHVGPFVDPKGHHHGGVGGATTDTLLNKTTFVKSASSFSVGSVKVAPTWMDLYKPTYLHLMIGTNDIIANPTSDEDAMATVIARVVANIRTMLALAHKSQPASILLISSIPTAGPSWFSNGALALNALLRHEAETGQFGPGVRFIDTAAGMNKAFSEIASSVTVDGTHPNEKGYALLADGVVTGLPKVSGSNADAPSSSGVGRVALAAGGAYVAYRLWNWWSS